MKKILFTFLLMLIAYGSWAQDYTSVQTMFERSMILNAHHHGFSLYDLDENRFVFGVNESSHFTPASNAKVYSLLTSLKHIGDSIPGIAYVVRGDSLLFWGTGDPTFLHPKLDSRKVYDFLSNSPYKLYYVPAQSPEPAYRAGWAVEDFQYHYQPDLATFPIYGNTVRFASEHGTLVVDPSYFLPQVTVDGRGGSFEVNRSFHQNTYAVPTWRVPRGFSTRKPFVYSDGLFVELLQDTLNRKVEITNYAMPDDVQLLKTVATGDVLQEMMLYSDNFLAEQLGYVSSFMKYSQFDTERLRKSMQDEYYRFFQDSISLVDGSGLSFYNKVTPRSMVELLLLVRDQLPDETIRFSLFPAGGLSGTLRSTYSLVNGKPFVWSKTGTIHAVYCQSGYLVSKTGKRYAFSFLNNNFFGNLKDVRNEVASIMTFIHHNF